MNTALQKALKQAAEDVHARFQPDYTPEQLENLGVYDALYRGQGPRLASLGEWKPEWISEHDPKGWAQWYKRYAAGRRLENEDQRQIKRWLSFKSRHGGPFSKNPTPRRGWALRNWAIDPSKLVPDQAQEIQDMLDEHQRKAMQKFVQEKVAASALRRLMTITPKLFTSTAANSAPVTEQILRRQATNSTWGPDAVKWLAHLKDREIGHIITAPAGTQTNPNAHKILYSHLDPQFQGMGLGRKMYMDVARQAGGELLSDTKVSPAAQRVWQGMQRRGYGVTKSPAAVNARGIDKAKQVYELPQYPRIDIPGSLTNTWDTIRSFFQRMLTPDANALNYLYKLKLPDYIPRIKRSELDPEIQLQDHQQRVADRVSGPDPRLLVYHGLGSGKSLSALAAAEMARGNSERQYGIVVPASLKGNFQKEVGKFTRNSNPEILSYTGLALGKRFKEPPETVIMDEAQRLRNPGAEATQGAEEVARQAKRLVLLSGTPITNSPTDLASLMSLLDNKQISPQEFEKRYIGYHKKFPGVIPWLRGAHWGDEPYVKNERELRQRLQGKVDYQPSKTPQGVTVNEETIKVPLSAEQNKIQKAIRTQIPPGFLWKLDQEFPLSRDELKKLNSFLTGLRQVSLSTQPFRADKNPLKAFDQSSKLREAMKRLHENLDQDPRRKAIIYSNFIDSGIRPYAKALEREKIPYGIFHGGVPVKARQEALKQYNEGKLRALLLGPAAAEGISTKGTSLIQLLDPYWHESRTQQARGRGLRFDSHEGLPEELKNVAVQRFLSASEEPGLFSKYVMGRRRQRTGDEILQHLSEDKEKLNEAFRKILREVGSEKYKLAKPAPPEKTETPH